jgi:1-deoxy-D-xylulose-5-phosphate synthase
MTGAELERMLAYAFSQNGPVSIRFPRGSEEVFRGEDPSVEPGSFRELKKGEKLCVVSLGTIGVRVESALATLGDKNLGHIDLRFLKPWNDEALKEVLAPYEHIITVEEGSLRGGLRDAMGAWLAQHLPTIKLTGIGLPDKFVSHGSVSELEDDIGMSTSAIKQLLRKFI